MRSRSLRCRTQTELLKWARERKRCGGRKRRREGLEWDTQLMINTSILIIVITRLPRTSAESLFLCLRLSPSILPLLRTHTRVTGNTFQIDVSAHKKILNSSFMHRPSYLISGLQNKITFHVQYCQSGGVPHQYFCWITNECFLWIVSSSPIPALSMVHEKSWGKHW